MTPKPLLKYYLTSTALWLTYLVVGSMLVSCFVVYASANTTANSSSTQYSEKIDYSAVESGSLFLKSEQGVVYSLVTDSDYQIDVNAMMARVVVTQSFINTSNDWVEGIYVFPLTEGAAVDDMEMWIGERFIKAEIQERKQAKKTYDVAKKAGKKASLVEQERPNMFTTSVANIPPGEIIKIKISYLQQVPLLANTFSLRLPLTITPRYIPKEYTEKKLKYEQQQTAKQLEQQTQPIDIKQGLGWSVNTFTVPDTSRITPLQVPEHLGQKASISINLDVGLPLSEVNSDYHQINHSEKEQTHKISLTNSCIVMNRDFVLNWTIKESSRPQAAYFKESKGGYDYGLFMITPPTALKTSITIPKEMIYIIDTSGSMGGVAIKQAKQALNFAVKQLTPTDRFNIIEFNSTYTTLFNQSEFASKSSVNRAINWISSLQANGGTEMVGALKAATGVSSDSGYIRQIVFITDGSVGNEEQLFRIIRSKLYDSRLHTVGIGSAPNSHFMERAAELGRGSFSYVGNVGEVKQKMNALFNRIAQPMLTDININWPSEQVELLPNKIPDLYATEPLIISARWPSNSLLNNTAPMTVSGEINQQLWLQDMPVNSAMKQSGIATWWARQKIKHLTYELYDSNDRAEKQQYIDKITKIAINNRLLSKYTSFVAVEKTPSRKLADILKKRPVPNAMPKGSTQKIPLAQTATNANALFKVGVLMLLITGLCMLATCSRRQYHKLVLSNYKLNNKLTIKE
ncbi:marine proteobacterial sortase target protein [Thalassotalea psychrophila]|uniref:Marine proteobacterial sortase target protein n=1 Tax=Thalassotalea psychrophila TaxID=3065647 RepID=A0ABY9TS40_9GAMM|nr:marine proteobacterial sortase target protein [Colwelliaceae bacterium SQ149]